MTHSTASYLAHLDFTQVAPSPALRTHVQCYWFIHGRESAPLPQEEMLYPDGGMGIIFNLGGTVQLDDQSLAASCFLDGTNAQATRLTFKGQIEAVGIRFQPGGAYPFLNAPLHTFMERSLLLDNAEFTPIQDVHQQLGEAQSINERITLMERWLRRCLSESQTMTPAVHHSLAAIRRAQGQLSIKAVAEDGFMSQRQLERLYLTQVGVSPKHYARIVRVRNALNMLRLAKVHSLPNASLPNASLPNASLADVGSACGFYDQSHFIREFQSVVGSTPQQYRLRRSARYANLHAES